MEIFEMMSFDFKEFVTSPAGILIIVGIICLIVGIIMFLKEGKKKKPVEEVKKDETVVETKPVESVSETTAPVEPAMVAPVIETPTIEAPVVDTPVVVPATNDGVSETPVPSVTETLNITDSVETNVAPVVPEVLEPVVEQPVDSSNVISQTTNVEGQVSAYGGVTPEVTVPPIEIEKPREIYGGANPLENTAPIPQVQNVDAYSANTAQPVVETPVVQEVVDVQSPVVETPAPVSESQPVVEPAQVTPAVSSEPVKEELEKLEF